MSSKPGAGHFGDLIFDALASIGGATNQFYRVLMRYTAENLLGVSARKRSSGASGKLTASL